LSKSRHQPAAASAPSTLAPASTPEKARSSRASGRVTLSDVAQQVGVSAMTVSRALRGERSVKPELVQRIRETVDTMGYVPDPAARALASQKSNQVLVLVPMLSNGLFVDLLEAVHKELLAASYYPVIGITHYDALEEEQLLRTYLPMRPAGLLLTGFDHTPGVQRLLDNSGIPCVHMMELSQRDEDISVGFSQEQAGACITQHLIDQGKRRIAFCAGQLDARVRQRANGWQAVLHTQGLYDPALEYLRPDATSLELGARMLNEVLANDPSVDAIFFCNDDIARGALLEALRLGIKVPERVAITGFNDLSGNDQMVPSLTSIRTPRKEIGTESSRLLLRLMRNEEVDTHRMDLGFELMARGSS
jgi:LacI family transcriptional regulator, gluconate utilization system Gnt-I transcriptional repressor